MSIPNQRGFTLIEVLIAMTLLSIMVALLFASLKICADSWQKGEAKLARTNEIAIVYQFFQHYLSTAKPLSSDTPKKMENVPAPLAFQGKKQSVQFVSALPASAARAGLQRFTVYKQQDQLKVIITPFFPSKADKEELVLLTGVSDVSLAYFGSTDTLDNTQSHDSWQADWLDRNTLPRLVKISLILSNRQFFPDILIALKLTEPLATPP